MTRMEWTAVAKGTRATYILKFWGEKEVGQPWLYFSLCLGNNNPLFLFYMFYDMSGFNVIVHIVHTKQEQNKISMMFERSHVTSGEDVR